MNMTPFQALYGRPIPDLNCYTLGDSSSPTIEMTLAEHTRVRTMLRDNLRRAQQHMTDLANSHRLDKQFSIGDMVYVRLKDYRQQSVQHRPSKKLSRRFYRPYKIIARIGPIAYKLELSPESRIHPMFHVSLL